MPNQKKNKEKNAAKFVMINLRNLKADWMFQKLKKKKRRSRQTDGRKAEKHLLFCRMCMATMKNTTKQENMLFITIHIDDN